MKNLILLLKSFRLLNVFSMLLLLIGLRFYFWNRVILIDEGWMFKYSTFNFIIFLFIVFLVSAGGNLINDIFDIESDRINKPKKSLAYSRNLLVLIYFLFNLLAGFLTCFFIESIFANYTILISIVLLFLYTFLFQRLPIIGNLSIAILSSFLPVLYYCIDPIVHQYHYWYSDDKTLFYVISFYSFIGFSITLLRELVKDIEDIEGDKVSNYNTFPVLAGVRGSQILFSFYLLLITTGLFLSEITIFNHFLLYNYLYYLPTFLFLLLGVFQVYKSNFSKASLFLKLTLFSGVLILFIL